MPTPETVLDNLLRTIGAAIYLVVLVSLVIFLVHETIMQIKWKMEERKNVQNCKSQETGKAN